MAGLQSQLPCRRSHKSSGPWRSCCSQDDSCMHHSKHINSTIASVSAARRPDSITVHRKVVARATTEAMRSTATLQTETSAEGDFGPGAPPVKAKTPWHQQANLKLATARFNNPMLDPSDPEVHQTYTMLCTAGGRITEDLLKKNVKKEDEIQQGAVADAEADSG